MTPRGFRTSVISFLAIGGLVLGAAVPAASAADVTILANDFESDSVAPWGPRGPVTLATTDAAAHGGTHSLSVTGRADGWQGPATSALALFTPGSLYTLSAWVRLAPGTTGGSGMKFTVQETTAAGDAFTQVNAPVTATADGWVEITGTYTLPDGLTGASLYIEAAPIGGVHPQFLVDDLLITGPPSEPGVDTLVANDFEGDSVAPWGPRGPVTLATTPTEAHSGGQSLSVTGRTGNWNGAALDALALFPEGTEVTVSAWVKLPAGTSGTSGIHFTVQETSDAGDAFTWVGGPLNTTADAWVEIGGTYTLPDGLTAASLYIEAATIGDSNPSFLVDDVLITAPEGTGPVGPEPGTVVIDTDFEDGLDGWTGRDGGPGAPTIELSSIAHGGAQAALVADRPNQGAGIGHDVLGLLEPGATYELTAWVRFAAGGTPGPIWLSMQRDSSFFTLGQFTGITADGWTEVTATFNMGTATSTALLYFETPYEGGATGNTSDFLVDDIRVRVPEPAVIEDLTPIRDTVEFPVGVAIDSRETTGSASELLLRHFDQITPENHMKPEAWYDADESFRPHPEADALMRFAADNSLRVYGHVLVWHSQTPAWFFQNAAGEPLTTSAADKQFLRDRLRTHIFDIAGYLSSEYGLFGAGNPLVAFDVVNEVVSDSGDFADGLRRSEWYRVLGEEYIDLAFQYADEAFNDEFAAPEADRPVTLFINDYNTEQSGKQTRYHDLVERLLDRGVPVDGVGHQFHVNLAMPVSALDAAITAFQDLPVTQAVTEFDVPTGTPVTPALLIDQGYYYRDAFRVFREHAEDLFGVTVWGLTDGRSWRDGNGDPLVFNDAYQAKPAYHGVVDGELDARLRTANVFQGDVPVNASATTSPEWKKLPLHPIEDAGSFQLRWAPDHLTAYVTVADATTNAGDGIQFELDGETYDVGRGGTGDVPAVASTTAGGYAIVAHLPLTGAALADTLEFDVRVTDGASTSGWNTPGAVGTLTLVEPLSYLEVKGTTTAPAIDGTVDPSWTTASTVTTAKQVQGTGGAVATVRTLWKDGTLYVLAEVADPVVDVSGSDPWIQDSVEIYVDAGNAKNGSYRYDDTQIRISATNTVSFGTGDEAFQRARVQSATKSVAGGYVVEAAISLLEAGGLGTFHGLDFQVNDASGGARTSIRNWADPTGAGYQSTARWGVGQLVAAPPAPPVVKADSVTVGVPHALLIKQGKKLEYTVLVAAGKRVVPTGTVTVFDGKKAIATITLTAADKGTATITLPGLARGLHALTAQYGGSATVKASTSIPIPVLVL